jgi:hypothetical protein
MGCLATHSLIDSVSKTWKHVVTEAVIGEIILVDIGQDSLFLQASSATNHAIRFGIFSCNTAKGGGTDTGVSTAIDQSISSVCVKGVSNAVYSVIIKACDSE